MLDDVRDDGVEDAIDKMLCDYDDGGENDAASFCNPRDLISHLMKELLNVWLKTQTVSILLSLRLPGGGTGDSDRVIAIKF